MITESLYIASTEETPEVDFNTSTGLFKLSGRSLPEDAFTFFKPLIEWLKTHSDNIGGQTQFHVNLDYFNSSSGRYLMEIFTLIERRSQETKEAITIVWCAEKEDEVMLEKGEEFKSLLELPFIIRTV